MCLMKSATKSNWTNQEIFVSAMNERLRNGAEKAELISTICILFKRLHMIQSTVW